MLSLPPPSSPLGTPPPNLFPIHLKEGLEKATLTLLPDSLFESEVKLKLIDRRTQEVSDSITQSSRDNTNQLNNLIAEAQSATTYTTQLKPEQR